MKTELQFKEIDLWSGKSPAEIWSTYRDDLDMRVSRTFGRDRTRPIVEVRDSLLAHPGANRT